LTAFQGRHLDEISRVDVRRYYLDRLGKSGPFAKQKRKVGVRTPQYEITLLSALYTFLQDEGFEIENPCHRPKTRRKDSPLASYKPAHEPVIPSAAQLQAIFSAEIRGKDGRPLVLAEHRALWKLCYYTAARPESEPCRLTHGDVEFSEGDRWGAVTYRSTKTGDDRRVLLHPEAEADLRAIMLPVPMRAQERELWRRIPVFRQRGSGKPWTRASYKKAWANSLRAAAKERSSLARTADERSLSEMWLRDLRTTAKTVMIDAGASELAVNRILGHKDGVAGRYYRLRDEAMREALDALTLGQDAAGDAGQEGRSGHIVLA
jgi:hypothetical protein